MRRIAAVRWGRRRGSRRPVPRPGPFRAAPPWASRGRPFGRGRSYEGECTTTIAAVASGFRGGAFVAEGEAQEVEKGARLGESGRALGTSTGQFAIFLRLG